MSIMHILRAICPQDRGETGGPAHPNIYYLPLNKPLAWHPV